ncbi:uncharacterized protein [Ptychodera flava]|uniref:uncharacterized protein n=1 Tax=Ptychodera flava TaxID=63121 RepID=UPI00396A51CD
MPSTRPMVILFVIVFSVHLYYSSYLATALRLPQPSFSSQWIPVRSQAGDDSFLEVSHDLGEVPIYVQVLARSVDGPNAGMIFKGVGSAQTDDDASDEYGGIVYSYSHETVRVILPTVNNGNAGGCVVYTGGSLWGTAIHQCSHDGEVKVDLWKEEDFPKPEFTSGFFDLSAENGASSFVEVYHGLNARPRLVSLQYTEKYADPDNIGFHYDGIGAAQSDDGSNWRHHGGIVFAYDNSSVRAWAPTVNDFTGDYVGALFSSSDGWSHSHRFLQGKVKIRVWGDKFPEPDITLGGHLQMGQDGEVTYHEMDLSSFGTSPDFVVVEVESISQPNEHFVFYGMGAQQARSGFKYGGLIFAYNNDKVTMWSPSEADGSVVNVIDGWGGEINAQSSKIANVTVKLWGTVKDACADDSHLKIDNRYRSSGFRSTLFTNSSDTICDSNIRKAWYRFVSEAGGEIPTTCINEGMCGTQYPVWINSPLPDVNFITTVDACINIDGDCCGRSLNIRMKNCQRGFFVYELRPLPTCPSAYCAGDREPCKPGQRSPTNGDFQPGCSELYPTLENPPNVQHVSQVATDQEVFFQCMFTASHWMNASYVVNWYLDDVLVKTEYIGGLKRTSSLYESEYQIGRQVSCDVSGSYVSFGIFGPAVSSNKIYIGFQVTISTHRSILDWA